KALVLYGSGHFDRYNGIPNLVQSTHPGRMFVVDAMGGTDPGFRALDDGLKSRARPVLFSLRRPPFQDLDPAKVHGGFQNVRLVLDGEQGLGQMVDACIYLGSSAEVEATVK